MGGRCRPLLLGTDINSIQQALNRLADCLESGGSGGSNGKVFVDGADTTADFLGLKLVAGTNITLTVLYPGANEQIRIDATGGPGTSSTLYDTLTAGGAFLSGDPVALDVAGNLVKANAEVGGPQEVYGLAITNGVLGNPATVVTSGIAPYAPGGLTPGDVLLLDLGGGIRSTPPGAAFLATGNRRIVRIGQARTSNTILVRVQVIAET